jgi:hypothetical protein
VTGLVIEADGLHTMKLPLKERLQESLYHGGPYPQRKMRGWLRKLNPVTKQAREFRSKLLEAA